MVVVQIVFGGINVVYKLAINDGISTRVLITYRLLFGAAFLVPIALIVERNKRPKMTLLIFCQIYLLGLIGGGLYHTLYLASLNLTSMIFAAAMYNLSPAFTFVVALCFRMETLSLNSIEGLAKVVGTGICIGGAMLLTFYKGIEINIWHSHINLLHHHHHHHHHQPQTPSPRHQGMGLAISLVACVLYGFWMILQAKVNENYPFFYSSTALMSLMGSIQAVIYAVYFDRKWTDWKLGWNIRLISVIYLGFLASGLNITAMAWCIQTKGPLYVAIFNPLMLLVVAVAGSLLFEEKLHLGSVLGGVFIIVGLYVVLWGKSKESKNNSRSVLPNDLDEESGVRATDYYFPSWY